MKSKQDYHIPVLFKESIEALSINPDGIYVDVTFGGGGHSRAIFNQLSKKGMLIAFDQDGDAIGNTWESENFKFVHSNFSFITNQLKLLGIKQIDGLLADLGVSSYQFDEKERGFSIRHDAKLDMRMSQSSAITAWNVINEYSSESLANVFFKYGEIRNSRTIASKIEKAREIKSIETTGELMSLVRPFARRNKEHKFLAQLFQSIRIEVNKELEVLESLLIQASKLIKPNGRLVVISYHSLEDRIVKNYLKRGSFDGSIQKDFFGNVLKPFEEVYRSVISPDSEEINQNSRSRSAKLRVGKKYE